MVTPGSMALGTWRMESSSSSHWPVWMSSIRVRLALDSSVTWTEPLVSFQMSQVSMVPKSSSPFSALALAPGTFSRIQRTLVPEK